MQAIAHYQVLIPTGAARGNILTFKEETVHHYWWYGGAKARTNNISPSHSTQRGKTWLPFLKQAGV